MVAVELYAPADPFQVEVDDCADCSMWFIRASNLAVLSELGGKVLLALNVRVPQARLFLGRESEVGEDYSLTSAPVCIKGDDEILNGLLGILQKDLDGFLGGSHIGEEIIHAGDGMLRAGWRTA